MASESPRLILSQDYELFFDKSGTLDKCLFEPCAALLEFADKHDSKITFFVDAGMLLCMERHASAAAELHTTLGQVKNHISSLANAGHEIALHVHPHWEDTQWENNTWQFANTRYQFCDFSDEEIARIFRDYATCLADLSGDMPMVYRAGGFCVEPFGRIRSVLEDLGIKIDSSVVPGALLRDPDKGFDFRNAPTEDWWMFDESPAIREEAGPFLELPVSVQKLPFIFYWGRLLERIGATKTSEQFGDGSSKRIGKTEIIRRLLGASRIAELSIDDAKAGHLLRPENTGSKRELWQVMGHPKLLSRRSLQTLEQFMGRVGLQRFETATAVGELIDSGDLEGLAAS